MDQPVVIRGSTMGGYGTPVGLAAIAVAAVMTGLLSPITTSRRSLFLWLFLVGALVVSVLAFELVSRRNFVKVGGDRVRWLFRQPPDKGDEPLANLQRVELFHAAGARLVFKDRMAMVGLSDFPRRRVNRLVDRLRDLGVQVNDRGEARR